jgi:arylsulfatase A-like enzyme
MEELHRKRLQSMLAVDDMIGDLVDSLRKSNELDDTYIFFTSDNGFHLGEHRLRRRQVDGLRGGHTGPAGRARPRRPRREEASRT